MPTTSYASGTASTPLLGETIDANLERAVERFADREALVDCASGRRLTYADLDEQVEAVARGLLARGVAKGDRVGIWAPNTVEWVLVQYATARIGAILVNINPAYRTHEVGYVLGQAGIGTLVSAPAFKTSDYRAMVDEVRPGLPALRDVVYLGERLVGGADRRRGAHERRRGGGAGGVRWTSTTPSTSSTRRARRGSRRVRRSRTTTSSTTGSSSARAARYTEADRICVPVPFYHCFGMVMGNLASTSHGACVVIPAPGFDPAATLEAVQRERCTSLYGVPTMFIAELALPDFGDYDLSSLRTGIMAGSPCPVEVMKRVISDMHMAEVTICYGMTETSPVSTQTRADDSLDRRTSTVGTVHPHLEVKVVDPVTDLPLPVGEPGELCTRGYSS